MRFRLCQSVCGFIFLTLLAGLLPAALAQEQPANVIPPIKRVLPPEGIAIPADVEKRLHADLDAATKRYEPLKKHELAPDIEIFLKAVRYALLHREFYTDKDFAKADTCLKEANNRITQLAEGKHPWTTATGTVVRGYRSMIDDSAQPYGMVIPKNFDFKQKLPLYTWLHGRGDKATDIHFITERMSKPGEITPSNEIVVHAFGRQCVGYLNAGEQDVIHAMEAAQGQYRTDENRRVLIGFSMGGAGAWHVGAHFADKFQVVAPGAGFAETAKYQKLKPEDYPPWYEQKLWSQNDTPPYVRNLFNTTVIAYSGELDRQIQAARVMEEAFQAEGKSLTHLIGPKTEHKYEPQAKAELLKRIDAALQSATATEPKSVNLQTRTLAYSKQYWVHLTQLEEHWQDTRVDATVSGNHFDVTTKNVAGLFLAHSRVVADANAAITISIDGQKLNRPAAPVGENPVCALEKSNGRWLLRNILEVSTATSKKSASVHGPIDDAFTRPFLVITPSRKSRNSKFQSWMEFELAHFRDRWRALMRGELREKKDVETTDLDLISNNLILWGDADSNELIRKLSPSAPIQQTDGKWVVGKTTYEASTHVPVLIYPNPVAKSQSIVLNSGLTFREAHDRTNSLQNPKLPDWAIIDITQNPDASSPGKVVNAGFFDEEWKLKPPPAEARAK